MFLVTEFITILKIVIKSSLYKEPLKYTLRIFSDHFIELLTPGLISLENPEISSKINEMAKEKNRAASFKRSFVKKKRL